MVSTPAPRPVDLSDPIYTIETVAALLHVSIDTARQYSYRADFPAARELGARLLWDREELLAWFRALPRRTAADRRRAAAPEAPAPAVADGTLARPYRRRGSATRAA
ncbi:helix-turn-helix protein [Oryzihumus leptocrescens]|uniref:Helix-turn-helix protein n=1 Tax=Oryzihumus leptocrescens TaxID=297536 RepID=A0A542ZIG3_9MICO|nr:helix-turn-helix domain-containing protein [Oryzihumus leptocrescens]TQL60137.1 helix-turn-helix protein [Oryzihumus leptocrescens]